MSCICDLSDSCASALFYFPSFSVMSEVSMKPRASLTTSPPHPAPPPPPSAAAAAAVPVEPSTFLRSLIRTGLAALRAAATPRRGPDQEVNVNTTSDCGR